MSRTLSANIQAEIAKPGSHTIHLFTFGPVNGTNYYFAEDRVFFQGNSYQPWLMVASPVKYTQKLQLDPVTVKLQNITLQTAAMLQLESSGMEGAEATLQRLYPACNEVVTLFAGRIAGIEIDQQSATITLAGDLDPTASLVPARHFSATCVWDFQDSRCGYTAGTDPNDPATSSPFTACPKDFLSCQARGRQHRFPGFIHISRDLTQYIEGQAPDAQASDRTLAALLRPWEEM